MRTRFEEFGAPLAGPNQRPFAETVGSRRRMTSIKARTIDVFSRAAPTYDSIGPRHFSYFAKKLIDFAEVGPASHVLDVATGTGAVLLAVAERVGVNGQVVGIDLSEAMLERAAAAVRQRQLQNVELRMMDAESLDLGGEQFDCVLCSFAFLAFPNKDRVVRGFRQVLKPGGRLGLVDAFGWFFQHDSRWKRQEDVLRSFGGLRNEVEGGYGPADLEDMLRAAGFVAIEAIEDCCGLVFKDEEEWWNWTWSHGSRRLLEAVPPCKQEELKRELFKALDACKEADGMIHGSLRASLVRARMPTARGPTWSPTCWRGNASRAWTGPGLRV